MMPGSSAANSLDRASRIAGVLENVINRCIAGEDLLEARIISEHPDLMPELAEELRELIKIDRARRIADAASGAQVETTAPRSPPPTLAPDWLPGYEILGETHRGGQGVVYRALQKATRRTVAIKVLREGPFAGAKDQARLELEVQILGQLRHPNIVTVHDGGVAAGHFYIVMDYIDGRPLDEHFRNAEKSSRQKVEPAELLELFASICDAVNAAHLQGVIHRDLKPSNILVDDGGTPHVLDFGLAKLTEADPGRAQMTQTGQFVGSLPWASPEQTWGPAAVDIRTDVYSLGVMLYQLLAGRFPYDVTGPMRDVLENIQQHEPQRPSRFARDIDDDVDIIALKCLHKDAERRYQTGGELARDIRRYLTGEPIEAKRDSGWYVLRKSLRRYRVPVAICAAFVALLLGATVGLSMLYRKAQAQTAIAKVERDKARDAQQTAQRRGTEVQKQSAKASKVLEFLQTMLTSVDPGKTKGREVTVKELLKQAATRADTELADQPEIAAIVQHTIGTSYWSIGEFQSATKHLQAALDMRRKTLGPEHLDVAESLNSLGTLFKDNGKLAQAEPLLREALAMRRKLAGDESAQTAETMNDLAHLLFIKDDAAGAEALVRESLEIDKRRLGPEHAEVAKKMANLAFLLVERGQYDEAESLFGQSLALRRKIFGDEHPDVSGTLLGMAKMHRKRRQYDRAESAYREVLALDRKIFGADHPNTTITMVDLGSVLEAIGKNEEAEQILRDALKIQRAKLDPQHPFVATTLRYLGSLLAAQGRYADAEPVLRESYDIRHVALGDKHADTLDAIRRLAELYDAWNKPGEADEWRAKLPVPTSKSSGPVSIRVPVKKKDAG